MERIDTRTFRAERAWGSRCLLDMGKFAARMHWTNEPYRWHANTGEELFVVLSGNVRMHVRHPDGSESFQDLAAGDAMLFADGDQHYAEPQPEARLLVIERKDSD